ncbi:MAG: efflux transporter outer membrane subunit [Flavobacteriales bacterium]|jgi:NodT family efflux transporter outer membrane factor (OMF) lipoprotein|nr:efflux transporter outer membrane subunit [Flavobacteriales bacterium]
MSIKKTIPALIALFLAGCASYRTDTPIRTAELPRSFQGQADSTSGATIAWREHFNDPVLIALIDTALRNNPDRLIALQRVEAARAQVRGAKGALLPEVGVAASAGVRKFGLYTMDGAGNITTEITPGQIVPIDLPDYFGAFTATWEVDVAGRLRNLKRGAQARLIASAEGANWVTSQLVAEVAATYYDLLALDNELAVARRTIASQEEALEVITAQKETGRANELAVEQFTAQLLSVQALARMIEQDIRETENGLNFLLGRYPQPIARDPQALLSALPLLSAGVPSQLLSNRPDIREAAMNVEAARFDLKAAKAAFYPTVTLTAHYGLQAFSTEYLFQTPSSLAYGLLGGLTAPLINRAAIEAEFRGAKAEQIGALHDYQRSLLNGVVEVSNALANVRTLQEVDSLKSRQSEVMVRSVETATELYGAARAEYLEVLFAQQNALQAQLELFDVKRRQRFATVDLYRALGGGWR